ncbi:MAG: SpoIIE family protein phosphatase [Candidatus Riflebacteria bacterium]|nr:SpoIIE family protein phosphatase [Candidatus Riflebacteria bacterium]
MKNIENEINQQKSMLWLLGLFTLILSVGLAQMISKSFINPLLILQNGALAIENRNFKHRLSGLAMDEFGEVGNIFNQAIVGLQELEIAKVVQENLFPKPEFEQGNFSIYGKSVTMIDVGGDYLDFFKVDDNSFAVLLGDVAGHGVGAAVFMAMAKAAILNSGELLRSPSSILNQLHKIILSATNSKQKKIMTFQYLYVNSETGENLYSNAGACSPWIIRHSDNSIQEIKMPGPVLGAFKKAMYKEMPLDLKPGDAIIFYTDGIVECKNKKGEMLGYDGLKQLLLNCWAEKPETYYNNIYKAYLDFVGADAEAGDDLTFIVLKYNDKLKNAN